MLCYLLAMQAHHELCGLDSLFCLDMMFGGFFMFATKSEVASYCTATVLVDANLKKKCSHTFYLSFSWLIQTNW